MNSHFSDRGRNVTQLQKISGKCNFECPESVQLFLENNMNKGVLGRKYGGYPSNNALESRSWERK